MNEAARPCEDYAEDGEIERRTIEWRTADWQDALYRWIWQTAHYEEKAKHSRGQAELNRIKSPASRSER